MPVPFPRNFCLQFLDNIWDVFGQCLPIRELMLWVQGSCKFFEAVSTMTRGLMPFAISFISLWPSWWS